MRAGTVVVSFGLSLLTLGALTDMALGTPDMASPREERPVLRLIWVDVEEAARAIRPIVMSETEALLDAAGVDVRWDVSDGEARDVMPGELQVVLLATHPPTIRREVMGAAPLGHETRTVWVFLAGVRATLGIKDSGRGPMPPGDLTPLGRAVARVVLHEVVHATTPSWPHTSAGLMSGRLRRPMLVDAQLVLEPALQDVFRAAARGVPIAAPAALAAAGGRIPHTLAKLTTD